MVKFSRNYTEKAKAAVLSLNRAKASNKTYNTPEVNAALFEMFHRKCYICENDECMSYQIEHLKPHKGNVELKYDWENLFLSCTHCNQIKRANDKPILDCSKIEVDLKIAFRKRGYFGTDEAYEFTAMEDSAEIRNTIALLNETYHGSTAQKKLEAVHIRRKLRRNLSDFKNLVREYEEAEEIDLEDLKCAIRKEVSAGSAFAAFKRWLLWDHKEKFGDLLQFCNMCDTPVHTRQGKGHTDCNEDDRRRY